MTTSNENEAFSVIDEVNDDEVVALPIYNGNGKTPTSAEPTTDDQAELITRELTVSSKGCDKETPRSHKESDKIPSATSVEIEPTTDEQ